MRTLIAIAGLLTGLVPWTPPASAHDAHRMVADKPIVTAEKDVPAGPRICLFSQNGKHAEPTPGDGASEVEQRRDHAAQPAREDAHREAAAQPKPEVAQSPPENDASTQPPEQKAAERVCDTDTTAPVLPHG